MFRHKTQLPLSSDWVLVSVVRIDTPHMRIVQILQPIGVVQPPFALNVVGVFIILDYHSSPHIPARLLYPIEALL